MSLDIVTVGEAMLRLWVPAGHRLEDSPAFQVTVAGAEANVAMAAARMGASTAWLSSLPDNTLGRRAAREIASHGVDVSGVHWNSGARMGLYFVELSVPPRPISVVYDRAESAAAALTEEAIDWSIIERARLVHLTGITPALSMSCKTITIEIVRRVHEAGALLSFDVNYRRLLWEPAECAEVITQLGSHIDLLIATVEDARDVFGIQAPAHAVGGKLQELVGARRVVVTAGGDGAFWIEGDRSGSVAAYPAEVVDRIGAGDAFAAGLLMGVLDDDLQGGVDRGLAMAALKLGLFGDQLAVTPAEVDRVMDGGRREIER